MASRRAPRRIASTPEALTEAYRLTFGDGPGETVLHDLKQRFGRRRSHTPGDPYTTAFNDGQRDVYLMILNMIDRDAKEPD